MLIKILKDTSFSIDGINVLDFTEDQIVENPEQAVVDCLGDDYEEIENIAIGESDDSDEDWSGFDLD